MTRSVTSAIDTALAADNVPILLFAALEFDGGTVYVTSNAYSIDWDGHTWLGLGELGSVQSVQEGAGLEAYGLALKLSGVPASEIATALDEDYQGRTATLWAAPLDSNHRIIADPVIIYRGRMDTMPISMGATAEITLNLESRLVDWERPRVRRYNDADQQAEYSGDLGFQFVEQMVEKELIWGRA